MAQRHPKLVAIFSSVLTPVLLAAAWPTRAAEPTKSECFAASEAWLNLRKAEKLIDARAQLLLCASASCPADVRDECSQHIAQLNAAIPSIVFVAQDGAGNDVTAVRVSANGRTFADRLDGRAITLDPGEYTFRFEIAGQDAVEKTVVVYRGEKDRREHVIIRARGAEIGDSGMRRVDNGRETGSGDDVDAGDGSRSQGGIGRGTVALVLGGVGVAGLAAGTLFALSASSQWSNAKRDCGAGGCDSSNTTAQGERDSAVTDATVATVAFAAGGAALAAALIVWLTAPKSGDQGVSAIVPVFAPSLAGMGLSGRF